MIICIRFRVAIRRSPLFTHPWSRNLFVICWRPLSFFSITFNDPEWFPPLVGNFITQVGGKQEVVEAEFKTRATRFTFLNYWTYLWRFWKCFDTIIAAAKASIDVEVIDEGLWSFSVRSSVNRNQIHNQLNNLSMHRTVRCENYRNYSFQIQNSPWNYAQVE